MDNIVYLPDIKRNSSLAMTHIVSFQFNISDEAFANDLGLVPCRYIDEKGASRSAFRSPAWEDRGPIFASRVRDNYFTLSVDPTDAWHRGALDRLYTMCHRAREVDPKNAKVIVLPFHMDEY